MEKKLKGTLRTRETAFSYQCHACNKCCYGKGIQINPYETMRLSSFLGMTTTEFIDSYLMGQVLKHKSGSNACIFLEENGCKVHKHRPLACRLYPLGRLQLADGQELFTELSPHPESAGEFGSISTVDNYLETQDVAPYLKAERAYMDLVTYMTKNSLGQLDHTSKEQIGESVKSELNYTDWVLDPNPVIEQYCTLKSLKFPSKTEQKLKLHLEAFRSWADGEWEPQK